MQQSYKNLCYRCGKERIITKKWKETIWNSVIENTESVCPDKECQATVERDMRKLKTKRLEMEKRKRESAKNRRGAVHNLVFRR